MDRTPLLSAYYFGSVEHYALMARSERIVIDVAEYYERQSYRTRTSIIGPNGKQDLTLTIARRSGEKMPMHSVVLSYAEPWNLQHIQAIRSAYGQTPWFIHYMPDIEALLRKRYAKLVELDLATMHLALKWLGLTCDVEVRETFVEDLKGLTDHRRDLHPKKVLPSTVGNVLPYTQVFADRHGFVGRLSIIDLVMNAGPQARRCLES
ncbi:MAG: WbqC family protein [Flavobacteriales bacterium]|nr:WbqC family protein [Flavobacteriales bacterium]